MEDYREIFTKIYDEHIDKIYRFIFLKVNSQDIAQDLCSETFIRAWNCFNDDKKDIENPQAFLYQIARNLIVDHYREKGRTQIVQVEKIPIMDPRTDIEAKSLQDSDFGDIRAVMANLKPEYQDIVTWHYVEQLTVPEIAKMLNKTEGNVRVTLHRALKSIKSKIEEV